MKYNRETPAPVARQEKRWCSHCRGLGHDMLTCRCYDAESWIIGCCEACEGEGLINESKNREGGSTLPGAPTSPGPSGSGV